MSFDELAVHLRRISDITWGHVHAGRRRDIRNERYFHHMFTTLVGPHLWPQPEHAWEDLRLNPEWPTATLFQFSGAMNVYDAAATAQNAIGHGTPGLMDLMIRGDRRRTLIEWKGPTVYGARGIAEVCLKLLTEPAEDLKVFAAIITSSRTDRADHRRTLVERFNRFGLGFTQQVLTQLGRPVDLATANFYAYIATIPDSGPVEVWCDRVTGVLPLP